MRNSVVLISKKLAGYCFFGMFVYIFVAKFFGLNQNFVIFPFAGSFFFFGLMALPTKSDMKSVSAWLLPSGMIMAATGLLLSFVPLMFFNATLETNIVIVGAIFFMLSICITFAAMGASDGSEHRAAFEFQEVSKAFTQAAKELGLAVKTSQSTLSIEHSAQGTVAGGDLELKVRTSKTSRSSHLANYSILTISGITNDTNRNIRIESINDALEFKNVSDDLKSSLDSFIKEKQLDYFNFRLNGLADGVRIEIDVAFEEKEAWIDYLELMKMVIV